MILYVVTGYGVAVVVAVPARGVVAFPDPGGDAPMVASLTREAVPVTTGDACTGDATMLGDGDATPGGPTGPAGEGTTVAVSVGVGGAVGKGTAVGGSFGGVISQFLSAPVVEVATRYTSDEPTSLT